MQRLLAGKDPWPARWFTVRHVISARGMTLKWFCVGYQNNVTEEPQRERIGCTSIRSNRPEERETCSHSLP